MCKGHDHSHEPDKSKDLIIEVDYSIREENLRLAQEFHRFLKQHGISAFEFLGSPGSGKTTLIECIIRRLLESGFEPYEIGYIGGDVATTLDTDRIRKLKVQAVQVNTGGMCHLEVPLVRKVVDRLDIGKLRVLFIENVGNLICPIYFPLGADKRILVVSVTEGEDKFIKHPMSVKLVDVIVINKVDLADAMGVDVEYMVKTARDLNPQAPVVKTIARRCEGIDELIKCLGLA